MRGLAFITGQGCRCHDHVPAHRRLAWPCLSVPPWGDARKHFKPFAIAAIAAAAFSGPFPLALAQTAALSLSQAQQESFRAAAAKVAPSVVAIETVGGSQPTAGSTFIAGQGPTTGLIYSADGLILTSAFNLVRKPSVITVVLPDGRRFVGELLARDELRQLAMLKIDAAGLTTPNWIKTQPDGAEPAAAVRVGQWAIALGRGFGGGQPSISVGIISGLNRQSGLALQTDAKLSPANYGGPLIDLDGQVIGIAVPMGMGSGEMAGVELYDSGIGFVIPAWEVTKSAAALAIGHSLRRGLLGVTIEQIPTAAAPDDGPARGGLRISGIGEPSPAQRAGLQKGDVIVAIDGRPVPSYPHLQRLLRPRAAGQRVALRVRRDQEEIDVRVVLAVPEDIGSIPQPQTAPEAEQTPPHRNAP